MPTAYCLTHVLDGTVWVNTRFTLSTEHWYHQFQQQLEWWPGPLCSAAHLPACPHPIPGVEQSGESKSLPVPPHFSKKANRTSVAVHYRVGRGGLIELGWTSRRMQGQDVTAMQILSSASTSQLPFSMHALYYQEKQWIPVFCSCWEDHVTHFLEKTLVLLLFSLYKVFSTVRVEEGRYQNSFLSLKGTPFFPIKLIELGSPTFQRVISFMKSPAM